jgi:hypothetical protein
VGGRSWLSGASITALIDDDLLVSSMMTGL